MTTLYTILGISNSASYDDIKRAYRKLVLIYHPDINTTDEAKNTIVLLNKAYEILSDDKKRMVYDYSLQGHIPALKPTTDDLLKQEEYFKKYGTIKKYKIQNPKFKPKLRKTIRYKKLEKTVYYLFIAIGLLSLGNSINDIINSTDATLNHALNGLVFSVVFNVGIIGSWIFFYKK